MKLQMIGTAALALALVAAPDAWAKQTKKQKDDKGKERSRVTARSQSSVPSSLDRNGDGVISRSEWRGDARAFDRLDLDRDGVLTPRELRRGSDTSVDGAFERLDRDRNGIITRAEWPADRDALFERLDRNRDGVLTRAEVQGVRDSRGRDNDDDWDRDDDERGMRFRGMDRNGDGRITRREWRGNDRSFDNHDRNRDGLLSGREVRN